MIVGRGYVGRAPRRFARRCCPGCCDRTKVSLARYLQRLDSRGENLSFLPIPGDEYTDDISHGTVDGRQAAVDSEERL